MISLRARETLAPLKERRFRLVFFSQLSSMLGDQVAPVAVAFAMLELTGSAADLGLVLAARTLPIVSFVLIGGVWADRLRRDRLMAAADLGRFATQGAFAALLLLDAATVGVVVGLQFANGVATAFFRPAATGLTPATVSPARLQQANALLALTLPMAQILGPAVGGLVVVAVGAPWAIALDAGTFALSALLLLQIRLPARPARAGGRSVVSEMKGGWHEVRARQWVMAMIFMSGALQLFFLATFSVLGPVVAAERLDGAGSWAAILTMAGAGSLVGGVVATRLKPARPLLLTAFLLLLAAPPLLLLGAGGPTAAIAGAAGLAGFGITVCEVLWITACQEQIPDAVLSRVSAYNWMGGMALRPLGYAAAGPVAAVIGLDATLWLAGALFAACVLVAAATPGIRGFWRPGQGPAPAPAPQL